MWLSSSTTTLFYALPLLPIIRAITVDCSKVVADEVKFDLSDLGGYHEVSWIEPVGGHGGYFNRTFKINICEPLDLEDKQERSDCKKGTRVCGIENWHDKDQFNHTPINTFPIWREFVYDGAHSDPKYTRLKSGEGNDESQKEGVRVVVGGGRIGKTDQKAVIEFRCKKDSERLRRADDENDGEPKDDKDGSDHPEWKEGEKADDGAGGLIEFQSYGNDTLRLNWYTPHGCEGSTSSGRSSESSGGWGFFSWFFFIVFMLLISYLLFSAWINYTRNGARGWDLLPHSDTIRDVPYIVGDWGRKIVGTMSGGGSRGGYSAV